MKLFWGWVFSGTGRYIACSIWLHGIPNSGVVEPGAETSIPSFLDDEIVKESFFRCGMVNETPSNRGPFHEELMLDLDTAIRGFFST